MVAILRERPVASAREPGLDSSDRSRFMTHVVQRSGLSHFQAYRLSRLFDELHLDLLTQQIAAFDRVAEHRAESSILDWDHAVRRWITAENQARAERAARHGTDVVYLPSPTTAIATGSSSQH